MRVNIEHKEETKGVIRKTHAYFVTVTVQFSEAERAIINARGLQEKAIMHLTSTAASEIAKALLQSFLPPFSRGSGGILANRPIMASAADFSSSAPTSHAFSMNILDCSLSSRVNFLIPAWRRFPFSCGFKDVMWNFQLGLIRPLRRKEDD